MCYKICQVAVIKKYGNILKPFLIIVKEWEQEKL